MTDPIVITTAKRTPIGAQNGIFKDIPAPALAAQVIKSLLEEAKLEPHAIHELYMGCVLTAGLGQAPARQAALYGGLSESVPCTTVGKVCGSGLKAIMLAADAIALGHAYITIAGGMESMSNAPHLLARAREGIKMGTVHLQDSMFLDGLQDAYDKGKLMGIFAEQCASHFGFTRQQQDEFALASLTRAQAAIQGGQFRAEITPFPLRDKKGVEQQAALDELPQRAKPEKIPTLKPAFSETGTITAANASSISDGAAAMLIMPASEAERRGLEPLAAILGHASHAQSPGWFTTAPVGAIARTCDMAGWRLEDIDAFEINEAFAVVPMAVMKEMNIPHEKVNKRGGACALGHPIGASGARILVTLLHTMQQEKLKRGIASLCIGGGEAVAIAVERM